MEDREVLIWKYLDNDCTEEENNLVEQLIKTDLDFRKKLEASKAIHLVLANQELDSPSMAFTSNLFRNLSVSKVEPFFLSPRKFFTILFGTMILALGINYFMPGHSATSSLISLEFLNNLSFKYTLSSWIPKESIYTMIVFSGFLLYWADKIMASKLGRVTKS